jgi:hypothetical protein
MAFLEVQGQPPTPLSLYLLFNTAICAQGTQDYARCTPTQPGASCTATNQLKLLFDGRNNRFTVSTVNAFSVSIPADAGSTFACNDWWPHRAQHRCLVPLLP